MFNKQLGFGFVVFFISLFVWNVNGWTTLMTASQNGNLPDVQLLISQGVNVNAEDNNGWTALMVASEKGYLQVVECLLDNNAYINKTNNVKWTALMIASQNNRSLVVKFLSEKNANVNAKDNNGWTALMVASEKGYLPVVECLVSNNANINETNNAKWTALMIASQNSHISVVKYLSEKSAYYLNNYPDTVRSSGDTENFQSSSQFCSTINDSGIFMIATMVVGLFLLSMVFFVCFGLRVILKFQQILQDKKSLETINSTLTEDLTSSNNSKLQLQSRIQELQQEKTSLETTNNSLTKDVFSSQKALEDSNLLVIQAQNQAENKEKHIKELQKEISQLQTQFQTELKTKDDLILQLQQKIEQLQQQQTSLRESLKSETSALTTVLEENGKLENDKKSLLEKIATLENHVSSITKSTTKLKSQIGEKAKEVEEKNQVIGSIQSNMTELQNQFKNLTETNQVLHQELTSYKNSTSNNNNSNSNNTNSNTSLPQFLFNDLKTATNDFSEQNQLGSGSFGDVYKGLHLQTPIAVKRLKLKENQTTQFQAELVSLSRFRHPNIISILGYSDDDVVEKCLVYEFAPNGSLRDRLDRKGDTPALTWPQRESIALGIAIGMNFLQNANPHSPFFHLDLKSANVLLDSQFNPKIADFGLAQQVIIGLGSNSYIKNTGIAGDLHYICPEYLIYRRVSRKTDVYSFGCILVELLTGKKSDPDFITTTRQEVTRNGNLTSKLDKTMDFTGGKPTTVDIVSQIFIGCIQISRLERPSFLKIIDTLLLKSVISEDAEETKQKECTDCSNAPINCVLKPCCHAVVCHSCAERWIGENKGCPACRLPIVRYILGESNSTFVETNVEC